MATSLICLKISPENVKQLSVKTSSARRSSVSVEGSLMERWSKKYLKCQKPFIVRNNGVWRGDVHGKEEFVVAWETINCFKMLSA